MKIHRYHETFQLNSQGSVVTIGNFDGMHIGHQKLVNELISTEKQNGLQSVLVTFEPLPREFFSAATSPARLMRAREKFAWLAQTELDHLVVLKFNQAIASLPAEQFVRQLLVGQLKLKHLIVGDDFRFGAKRQGDIALLEHLANELEFKLSVSQSVEVAGERVSSSRVRQALTEHDFGLVKQLLGRHYSLAGRVCHGDKRGRELGFPTANLPMRRINSPVRGIYVVQVKGLEERALPGVASIGIRPAIGGELELLEVFLFDFDREIYGEYIEVDLLHKLRDEAYYPTLEALTRQIKFDVTQARNFFAT